MQTWMEQPANTYVIQYGLLLAGYNPVQQVTKQHEIKKKEEEEEYAVKIQ